MQQTDTQQSTPKLRLDSKFWTAREIAYEFGYSVKTVQNHIITRDDFPKPYILPGEKRGGRRWDRDKVRGWLMGKKGD